MQNKTSDKNSEHKAASLEKELEQYRKIARELHSTEINFTTIFKQTFLYAVILDTTGVVLEMNDLCRDVCGDLAEGVVGHSFWEAGWWNEFENIRQSTQQAIKKVLVGEVVTDRATFIDKHGRTRHGIRVFSPIRHNSGRIYQVSVLGLDISDDYGIEQTLLESKRNYRHLINSFPGLAYQFVVNAKGAHRFDFIGEKCYDIFGFRAAEIMADARKVFDLIPEPDAELVSQAIDESYRTLKPYKMDHRIRKKSGQVIWIHTSSIPSKQPNGDVIWDGIAVDITEHKLAEENLQIYKNIVSSTPDGMAFLDSEYRYVIVNDAYENFSGIGREHFLGKTVAEYLGHDVFDRHIKPRFDQCLQGETVSYRDWFNYPTLGKRFAEVTYFPYKDAHNQIVGVVAATRDMTEQEQARQALNHSYEGLKLRQNIASSLLTCPDDRAFDGLVDLLRDAFACRFGYIGYIDENGDLVCPSMTVDIWSHCRIPGKNMCFAKTDWDGIWGHSLLQRATIVRNHNLKTPDGHVPLKNAIVVPLVADGELVGQIALANKPSDFTAEDQGHLESLSDFIAPVLKIYIEKERAEQNLQAHAKKLEEKNIALKVLIESREEDKRKMAEAILAKFEKMVFPYFEKLKKHLNRMDIRTIVDIIKDNTLESLSPLDQAVNTVYRELTPTEMQVADLIKKGKTSKQIGALLNTSTRSIFFHRNNIRKKLGLQNSKANLRSYLLSLE